ncbi:MAG: endonuclease/exonuclease/phosphatase family protein [archaeon]|nr:endonuclease/exonuclease/phosphatase family protein [archaeon]
MKGLFDFLKHSALSLILSSCGSHYTTSPDFSDRTNINLSINQEMPDVDGNNALRVMTYNIAHGRGPVNVSRFPRSYGSFFYEFGLNSQMTKESMYRKLDEIAELIIQINPEVVSLNEIDFNAYWSFEVDQLRYLSEKTGMKYYAYGTKWNSQLFFQIHCGNGVLSKYPLSGRNLSLDKTDSFVDTFVGEHSFMDIYLDNGRKINFVNTHLGGGDKTGQAEIIRDEVLDDLIEDTPVIITGDLNTEPGGPAINVLLNTGYFSLFKDDGKFPTSNNDPVAIDHIIASKHFIYEDCFVPDVYYSDHKSVVCDLIINPENK